MGLATNGNGECLGHQRREERRNKITKLSKKTKDTPDETLRTLGTSLKELEDNYDGTPEWKVVKDGGVLSIPMAELRMQNPPRPDRSGHVVFTERRGGNQIDSYPVVQEGG